MKKLKPGVTVRIGAREFKGEIPSELASSAPQEVKKPASRKSDGPA